jgi:hypothetical protein
MVKLDRTGQRRVGPQFPAATRDLTRLAPIEWAGLASWFRSPIATSDAGRGNSSDDGTKGNDDGAADDDNVSAKVEAAAGRAEVAAADERPRFLVRRKLTARRTT